MLDDLLGRDVNANCAEAHRLLPIVLNHKERQCNVYILSVFALRLHLHGFNRLSPNKQHFKNMVYCARLHGSGQNRNVLADDLGGAISVYPLRPLVPVGDYAVKACAQYRILR
jgi:hypothetical protein